MGEVVADDPSDSAGGPRAFRELADVALHEPRVEVHPGTGLPRGDFRRKGNFDPTGMDHFAHRPLGQRHPVSNAYDVDGRELDFLLSRLNTVDDEVVSPRVDVLHRASYLREAMGRLSVYLPPF